MKKKLFSLLLALSLMMGLAASASAAEVQTHEVPVTLTVVNTVQKISVTVPAALPVSVVDGYVVTATNAAIRNTADSGSIQVTGVAVTDGAFTVGNYENFAAIGNSIALSLNGCGTTKAGALGINSTAFPAIEAGGSLPIRYAAKVSADGNVSAVTAATVVFTIAAVENGGVK